MQIFEYAHLGNQDIERLARRTMDNAVEFTPIADAIVREVKEFGDNALRRFTKRFDGVELTDLAVSKEEMDKAELVLDQETVKAIHAAIQSVQTFHRAQVPKELNVQTHPGVDCKVVWRPIRSVGLYVPGGSAPLLSTAYMLGVPAVVAGCSEIIVCTPPKKDGTVSPGILAVAKALGITKVFKVGGAQAIAAMALGTESIPKVDKIFGPGNQFVTAMKTYVTRSPYNVAIDLPAGPSELLILADARARARWVAADLLSQAEHGADSPVVLVTDSQTLAKEVSRELDVQIKDLPRRAIAARALEKSFVLRVRDLRDGIKFSNLYAPEHLILAVDNPENVLPDITAAGSVFLGPLTSVVLGDYASGPNHTLPTGGTAAALGGVTVMSFMKPIFAQTVSAAGFRSLAPVVKSLAAAEGLEAHARAVALREDEQ
jgi:histidinol dehydrogenase